jgi:SAM-dependent methyltransferase
MEMAKPDLDSQFKKTEYDFLTSVDRYYSDRVAEHGATPKGVDWNGAESQELRFSQLMRVCDASAPFSLNDIGCGYGQLSIWLRQRNMTCDYQGCDISAAMIEAAREGHGSVPESSFLQSSRPDRIADYAVASGIFNVRLETPDADWKDYILSMLDVLHATSTKGFAFNCLTQYSDRDRMRSYLYYADPTFLFDYCMRHYSRQVALLHDYGLFEFTLLVRK